MAGLRILLSLPSKSMLQLGLNFLPSFNLGTTKVLKESIDCFGSKYEVYSIWMDG